MTDELNKKVINLFSAHKKAKSCQSGNVCKNSDGYFYISIETDENGRHFDEETLLERAGDFYYIVKVLVKNGLRASINNYKIPGDDLLKFIKIYIDGKGEGQIIEIDKFFPDEWA
ncbi:MAG TPA: hypothetical protein P5556_04015 [Candidatus Gastranaerophilales bacterium]|nr:hypothetical protein [Candidatus Gastranaerophilales bacterium]